MHPVAFLSGMFFLCFFAASGSHAAVTTIQALSFGSFIVKNNDAQYDITINTDSSYSADSAGFIEISSPQEGIYDFDSLPASTAIVSVVVTQVSPLQGPGNSFQMLNFQEVHPGSTDASGVARIEIGATARTTGTGTAYPDQAYNGSLNVQINF